MKRTTWLLGAGWLVFLLYAYPGYLQSDSANQLVDSRVGDFTDWQAPIMTEIWRIVGRFISGPAGMLLLQSGLVLFGTYLLARRAVSDGAAAIIASCALALPPAMVTTALITPEALLAGLLLCGAAALTSDRRRVRLGGLGLVALGCGLHDGAPLAALPIVAALFVWHESASLRRRLAISVAAWLAAVLVAWGLSWLLVDMQTERDDINLAMRDLSGTLALAPDARDDRLRVLAETQPDSEQEREALFAARRELIRAEPVAYLRHRGTWFFRVLGITKQPNAVYTEFVAHRDHAIGLQHLARHSAVQRALIATARGVAQTPLMRPYLYFALALVLLPLAIVRKHRIAAVLLASALAYELSLFVTASRAEYRDSHWLIVATLVASGLVIAGVLKARHERVAQ